MIKITKTKISFEDHIEANKIYDEIVEILIGKDLRIAKLALKKIEFNLYCAEEDQKERKKNG